MYFEIIRKLLQAVLKYLGKNILRKSGVFGIYGSFKTMGGFKKVFKEIGKSNKAFKTFVKIVKKNALRSLHGANFIRDLKFGAKEQAKRVFMNRLLPMEARKLKWFFNELIKTKNRTKTKLELQNAMFPKKNKNSDAIIRVGRKNVYIDKDLRDKQAKFIDDVRKFRPKDEKEKELIGEFKEKDIVFSVISPQTHNFNRKLHRYSQKERCYYVPIRSGWYKNYQKTYCYQNIPWYIIYISIVATDYGVQSFNLFRTDKN